MGLGFAAGWLQALTRLLWNAQAMKSDIRKVSLLVTSRGVFVVETKSEVCHRGLLAVLSLVTPCHGLSGYHQDGLHRQRLVCVD